MATEKSLPARERGLKLRRLRPFITYRRSLPARERGLKLWLFYIITLLPVSLPARERGLKQRRGLQAGDPRRVAPRAGAWIETRLSG